MAAKIPQGVQLYLYRLLTQAFGTGRQAFLPKVEEALAADGITPYDLECADVRELLACLDFVTLTDFKGGRSYATVVAVADFDEALAALGAEDEGAKPAKKGRPWKRRRGGLKPIRPRKRALPAEQTTGEAEPEPEEPEADTATEVGPEPKETEGVAGALPPSQAGGPLASLADARPAQDETEDDARAWAEEPVAEEPVAEEPPVARTLAEILAEARAEEERERREAEAREARAEEERERREAEAREAETQSSPQDTGAFDVIPGNASADAPLPHLEGSDDRGEGRGLRGPHAPAGDDEPRPQPAPAPATPALPRGLPTSFGDEVHCPDAPLATLTSLLPLDADVHAALEEGWRISAATGTLRHDRRSATFDLRYLRSDGTPIAVTISRAPARTAARRWVVSAVEGDEGVDVGIEGARPAAEGAWAELSAAQLPPYRRRALLDEFAGTMAIGSWEDLCARVCSVARPEPWGRPGDDSQPVLREYLLVSLTRAAEQGRVIEAADGGALWNTGLLTGAGGAVVCLLGPARAGGPRPLVDVCPGSDPRVTRTGVPEAASYLASLDDLLMGPTVHVACAPRARVGARQAEAALRRAQASWRAVVPVWDPQERRVMLLLPAATAEGGPVDAALVARREDDELVACGLMPLETAYALARVTSPEQPAWLAGALA